MTISRKTWDKYIKLLGAINETAAREFTLYIEHNGTDIFDVNYRDSNGNNIIDLACYLANRYGNASAAVSAQMFEAISELSGVDVPYPELEPPPSYDEVAKTINGVLKVSRNTEELTGAVTRLVKRTGLRTTRRNAKKYGAEYAWIPNGDTCAWCVMLAGKGWQTDRSGQPEHLHSNCDCTYAVRYNSDTKYAGYDPEEYADQYRDAEGSTRDEKLNSMRRKYYAQNREEILAQKADAYAKRQELNSSSAEEMDIN